MKRRITDYAEQEEAWIAEHRTPLGDILLEVAAILAAAIAVGILAGWIGYQAVAAIDHLTARPPL